MDGKFWKDYYFRRYLLYVTPFTILPGFILFAPIESNDVMFALIVLFALSVGVYFNTKKCPQCDKSLHYAGWADALAYDPFRRKCIHCGFQIPDLKAVLKSKP